MRIASLLLALSGIATLTHQVAWVRLLSLSMGSTSASVSTVLAAFFFGMAAGSYLAERMVRGRGNDLRVYIVLELLIGLSGLAVLPGLLHLDDLMALATPVGKMLWFKFMVTFLLLAVPTVCMGATFPVISTIFVRRQNDLGQRLSQLYSLNTAGAVLGAALSGFVFIPRWGLDGAVFVAVILNLTVALLAFCANKRVMLAATEDPTPAATVQQQTGVPSAVPLGQRALLVLFVTGLVSIAAEVGWTKYLSIFTGTTVYGFAAILTVFLTGITAGSWFIRRHLERIRSPAAWLVAGLLLLGAALFLTRSALSIVPSAQEFVNQMEAPALLRRSFKYGLVFLLLFVPTFLFGALFPLSLKVYTGDVSAIKRRVGRAYALNTLAGIVGSVAAGFWLIPSFGTDALLKVLAVVTVLLPAVFFPALQSGQRKLAAATLLLVLGVGLALPGLDYKRLVASVQYRFDPDAVAGKEPEFLYLREGRAGVISMVTYDGRYARLQNNGINESKLDMQDPRNGLIIESLLGLVPFMLHPAPRSAFVVGFGGGTTTRALTYTTLEQIRVVELEPAVIEAVRTVMGDEMPSFSDPRVEISCDDARSTLLLEKRHYDLILSQPSHPWLAGSGSLFTREFFELVEKRLNEGGIYGQWLNLFNMDVTTLRSILQAFYGVFEHGFILADLGTSDMLIYGSNEPLLFDQERMASCMDVPEVELILASYQVREPSHLLWYFALSRQDALTAAGDIAPNTDTRVLSEVRLALMDRDPEGPEDPFAFLEDFYNLDVLPYLAPADRIEMVYDAGRYMLEWQEVEWARLAVRRLKELDSKLGDELERLITN